MSVSADVRVQVDRASVAVGKVLDARVKGRRRQVMVTAFARALVKTPVGSAHGRVLMAAIRDTRASDPVVAMAVAMATEGTVPTAVGVDRRLCEAAGRRARLEAVRVAVEGEGPRAAAYVAEVVARTGSGPTWGELVAALGLPATDARFGAVSHLIEAGWLTATHEPRSLRPGPRAALACGEGVG